MSYFAEINENGIVLRVIVADQSFVDSGVVGKPEKWVESGKDNLASAGYSLNTKIGKFVPPKPYESWTLNETTATWDAPKAKPPEKGHTVWHEKSQDWLTIEEAIAADTE